MTKEIYITIKAAGITFSETTGHYPSHVARVREGHSIRMTYDDCDGPTTDVRAREAILTLANADDNPPLSITVTGNVVSFADVVPVKVGGKVRGPYTGHLYKHTERGCGPLELVALGAWLKEGRHTAWEEGGASLDLAIVERLKAARDNQHTLSFDTWAATATSKYELCLRDPKRLTGDTITTLVPDASDIVNSRGQGGMNDAYAGLSAQEVEKLRQEQGTAEELRKTKQGSEQRALAAMKDEKNEMQAEKTRLQEKEPSNQFIKHFLQLLTKKETEQKLRDLGTDAVVWKKFLGLRSREIERQESRAHNHKNSGVTQDRTPFENVDDETLFQRFRNDEMPIFDNKTTYGQLDDKSGFIQKITEICQSDGEVTANPLMELSTILRLHFNKLPQEQQDKALAFAVSAASDATVKPSSAAVATTTPPGTDYGCFYPTTESQQRANAVADGHGSAGQGRSADTGASGPRVDAAAYEEPAAVYNDNLFSGMRAKQLKKETAELYKECEKGQGEHYGVRR